MSSKANAVLSNIGIVFASSFGTYSLQSNSPNSSNNIIVSNVSKLKNDKNEMLSFNSIIDNNQKNSGSLSVDLTRNLSKLNEIKKLKLGEEKPVTFSNKFIDSISDILFRLKYQPEVFPNFDGNIQFEYEKMNGKYLEIEITPSMKVNIFKIDENGNEYENEDYRDLNIDSLKNEVNEFYGYN